MARPKKSDIEQINEILEESIEPEVSDPSKLMFVPTGSTLLNCAISDRADGGWPCGRFCTITGDSSSGKTLMAITAFAEAANDPRFDDYLLIYDDAEAANTFDIERMFGKKLAARIRPPRILKDGDEGYANSNTVEDFYANVWRLLQEGKPFIYILDSVDALTTKSEKSRADEYTKAQEDGKEVKGSYKMDKPKLLSEILQTIVAELSTTNSLLLSISQTRDNIDPRTSMFNPKTRSGGRALKFYATVEAWLAHRENLKNSKYNVKIGDRSTVKISKNKVTGKQRDVNMTIYYSYGIDDIAECVKYLETVGVFEKSGRTLKTAEWFGEDMTADRLITYIDLEKERYETLKKLVETTWNEIESELTTSRKPRYE